MIRKCLLQSIDLTYITVYSITTITNVTDVTELSLTYLTLLCHTHSPDYHTDYCITANSQYLDRETRLVHKLQ